MYPLFGFFLLGHLEAATAFLIAGSSVILTSLAMEDVQLLGATFVRYFFAFIFIFPFCLIFRSKITIINPRDLSAISTLGILFCFIFSVTFNKGLQLTSASRGALIVSFIPTLTLIFGFFFTVEKMSIYRVLGCIIAFLGVAIGMSSRLAPTVFSNSTLLGDCFIIAAIIQGAIFSVFSRPYFHKYGVWLVTVISISIGFLG